VTVYDDVYSRVARPAADGDWTKALCVVHETSGDGHKPSLRFKPSDTGDGVVITCMGGCAGEDLRAALCLGDDVKLKPSKTDAQTFLLYRQNGNGRQIVASYDYCDEAGHLLYQKVRYAPKEFVQRRQDGAGGWIYSLTKDAQGKPLARAIRRVLYRLSEVLAAAKAGELVFVNEGEKGAEAVRGHGLVATCASGGAGRWSDDYADSLQGTRVAVIVDNDGEGRKHGALVIASLRKKGIPCATVEIPGLPPKGDAHDAVAAGMTKADLVNMAEHALELAAATPPASLPIHTVADLVAMHIAQPEYIVGPPFALARGTVAELDAYPKHGKTRLTLDAIWSILHGLPFLDAPTVAVKTLYLTEEWLITWQDALREAHLFGEDNRALCWMSLLDLQGHRDGGDWSELCEAVRAYCVANEVGLLVVDTLARWAGVADESDPQLMAAAVMSLRLIAAENIAVLFLRHDRKGGGVVGESGRGSSATSGEADFIVHLQRKAGQGDATLRQRELEGIGRLTGMTGKLIVELNARGHFDLLGDKGDVAFERAKQHALAILPAREAEAWTMKEIAARFDGSESTCRASGAPTLQGRHGHWPARRRTRRRVARSEGRRLLASDTPGRTRSR
jgi:AAA domain